MSTQHYGPFQFRSFKDHPNFTTVESTVTGSCDAMENGRNLWGPGKGSNKDETE